MRRRRSGWLWTRCGPSVWPAVSLPGMTVQCHSGRRLLMWASARDAGQLLCCFPMQPSSSSVSALTTKDRRLADLFCKPGSAEAQGAADPASWSDVRPPGSQLHCLRLYSLTLTMAPPVSSLLHSIGNTQ